jgi:hypothetical protein
MSPSDPVPGDLIVLTVPMRAWEDDDRRGRSGPDVPTGTALLVIEIWEVGSRVRLRVVYDDRIIVISCRKRVTERNWKLAREG